MNVHFFDWVVIMIAERGLPVNWRNAQKPVFSRQFKQKAGKKKCETGYYFQRLPNVGTFLPIEQKLN
ncbi:MAG: hypothetical protein IKJ84_04220 [Oscillospiraceae bacterium]|nr:hypothetical protein [Oscillospiraceae bacterium]